MLDLLLINTQFDPRQFSSFTSSQKQDALTTDDIPHIGLAYLLAVAKKYKINARVINLITDNWDVDSLLNYIDRTRPLVVGFTAFTVQVSNAAVLATRIKDMFPSVFVCIGGPHATAIPLETLRDFPAFDFAVRGEAEEILPKIFDNLNSLDRVTGIITKHSTSSDALSFARIKDLGV